MEKNSVDSHTQNGISHMKLNYKINEGKVHALFNFIMPGTKLIAKKCPLNKCVNEHMNECLSKRKDREKTLFLVFHFCF